MARKKAEFKNLGKLPMGEWTIVGNTTTGSLLLACADHEPIVISNGKLTKLADATFGGKPNGDEKSGE